MDPAGGGEDLRFAPRGLAGAAQIVAADRRGYSFQGARAAARVRTEGRILGEENEVNFISKRVAMVSSAAVAVAALALWAQDRPVFRVKVDMVVLSFTV